MTNTFTEKLTLAKIKADENNFIDAISILEEIKKNAIGEDFSEVHAYLGYSYIKIGKYENAKLALKKIELADSIHYGYAQFLLALLTKNLHKKAHYYTSIKKHMDSDIYEMANEVLEIGGLFTLQC